MNSLKNNTGLLSRSDNNDISKSEKNNQLLFEMRVNKQAKISKNRKFLYKTHKTLSFMKHEDGKRLSKLDNNVKIYRPLLGRFIRIRGSNDARSEKVNVILQTIKYDEIKCDEVKDNVLSKKDICYACRNGSTNWVDQKDVVRWLLSIGIVITQISNNEYILQNKRCSFNHVMIFANRKRLDENLSMFLVKGITEL